ncbi:hypothetical protein HanIR_Chr10g0452061 [Helianthus annuus]|nr:hypothetical protein HanIR_Chr10g0452061 [Helianthus annuus]
MKSTSIQFGVFTGGFTNVTRINSFIFSGVCGNNISAASSKSFTTNNPSVKSFSSKHTPAQHITTLSTTSLNCAAKLYATNPP